MAVLIFKTPEVVALTLSGDPEEDEFELEITTMLPQRKRTRFERLLRRQAPEERHTYYYRGENLRRGFGPEHYPKP